MRPGEIGTFEEIQKHRGEIESIQELKQETVGEHQGPSG